jgi:O-antigen ligase
MNSSNNNITSWASYILMALPISIALSPPLTSLLEAILYTLFIFTPELRKRFVDSLSQPMVMFGFLLCFVIFLSSLWGDAPWEAKIEHMISWRKILLLPIAISLINTPILKDRFLLAFIISVMFFAILSWASYLSEINLFKEPHKMLRNHATQGMVFFIAAFSSASLLAYRKNLSLTIKITLGLALLIIISNGFYISTSRSGYAIGLVLITCFGLYTGGKKSIALSLGLLIITMFTLYLSPTSSQQIKKTWGEAIHIDGSQKITSGGARVTFWKNTIPVIKTSPIIGHGLKSLPLEYAKQVKGLEGWQGVTTRDPHNQYLLLLAEQGLIGLLALFAFIGSCFFQKTDAFYRLMGISVLLGWMTTSLFNGHFSASVEGKFLFLWCAAMLSMPLPNQQKATVIPAPE